MPGSTYHKVALQVAEWLAKIPEAKINSSAKKVADKVKSLELAEDEEMVSFYVSIYERSGEGGYQAGS